MRSTLLELKVAEDAVGVMQRTLLESSLTSLELKDAIAEDVIGVSLLSGQ